MLVQVAPDNDYAEVYMLAHLAILADDNFRCIFVME